MNHLKRIARLQEVIRAQNLAGAVLAYSRDIYYYTGLAQPAWLLVRPGDWSLCLKAGLEYARAHSGIDPERLFATRRLAEAVERVWGQLPPGTKIGAGLDRLFVRDAQKMAAALGGAELIDISPQILQQRMIKDPDELALVDAAGRAALAGHESLVRLLKEKGPGISELEAAAAVEQGQRLAGHEGVVFFRQGDMLMSRGPVAAGPNLLINTGCVFTVTGTGKGPSLPAGPSLRPIQKNELLLVDIPPCVQGYHCDQTRMYVMGGIPPRAGEMYAQLKEFSDAYLAELGPGLTCNEAYALALDLAGKFGVAHTLGRLPMAETTHFVAHGLGLEISEPPLVAPGMPEVLQTGMVLALEMHLYDGRETLVKLEDTLVITDDGCRLVTIAPREITVV